MHIFNQLIDSFPLTYSQKSCDKEKLSMPLEPHHKAQSSEIFLSFMQKIKRAVLFYLLGNVAETPYLTVRDGKLLTPYGLSNSGKEKLPYTPFWGGPKLVYSDGLRAGTIENHHFFVLSPNLVKFHIRTQLFESFRRIFRTWWCGEEKSHFTSFHTLR